ncbi:MAG: ATP-binding protein, partial [Methanomicrobiales archaeon]|nr:ATP-binding protein [Methanomicrobiales archaeon]
VSVNPGKVTVKDYLGTLEVFADPLISKVWYNLIENAVRHGGPDLSTITFSFREHKSELVILCQDDGGGIPTDEKEKIFCQGYGKNTGFGLFLTREILGITNISICETGEVGVGARFEIHIPPGMYRNTTQDSTPDGQ